VAFDEIDIRRVPGAIDDLIRLRVQSAPALVVGDKIIVGFDPAAYDQAISAEQAGGMRQEPPPAP
jgi:hypothetical protein